jgi:hypothetical protein
MEKRKLSIQLFVFDIGADRKKKSGFEAAIAAAQLKPKGISESKHRCSK